MMNFRRDPASPELQHIIECFWTVEGDGSEPERQKIIPDAFVELIFHFGDPYRIKLRNTWELQSSSLLAGQISRHFFLKNTGRSDIFAIKLKPSAITHLFGIEMNQLTDRALGLGFLNNSELLSLDAVLRASHPSHRKEVSENFFRERASRVPAGHPVDRALFEVLLHHGAVNIRSVAAGLQITERYLEQLFKKYVGLSPKFFSRIVRFNRIFQLIRDDKPDWSELVFRSGYYDQSHFIRNFKAFTGDDPTKYIFDRKDLANFFLKQR